MRVMSCRRCQERMWEDEDGSVFCGSCGWEVGTALDEVPDLVPIVPTEPSGQLKVFDNYPEYVKNLQYGIY